MWPFFAVWASCRDRSEAQTPATLTQCDLRQLGNAQEDTKNLYAARALPCTHRKLHLAVYTLWPTASLCEYFKKKRAKSLLVPFRGMIFISCAVQLADWGLLAGDERKCWSGCTGLNGVSTSAVQSIKCQKTQKKAHNELPEPMWHLWMSRFYTHVFMLWGNLMINSRLQKNNVIRRMPLPKIVL